MERSAGEWSKGLERAMGFEPHSVAGSALETCLPAPAEGASPLAHSPRKGLTPFESPCRGFNPAGSVRFGAGDGI